MAISQSTARAQLAGRFLKYSISVHPRRGRLLAAAWLAGACSTGEGRLSSADPPSQGSMGAAATAVSTIQVRARSELRENSAAVMSASQAGILFTINDSGNDAVLFALDTAGNDRGAWHVRGARNMDWEAAGLGPCGPRAGGADAPGDARPQPGSRAAGQCLYIGDVGDNAGSRPTRVIYRLPEPRALAPGTMGTVTAERLEFRYADRPHDVEGLWVGGDGTIWLITKRRLRAPEGPDRRALIFALDAGVWNHPDSVATARLADSIPVVPGSAPGRMITDAALSHDGKRIAFRTYTEVFVFDADSATGRVVSPLASAVCNITGLRERQGEGITWLGTSGRLLLTSEGNGSPMHIITCESPGGAPQRPN